MDVGPAHDPIPLYSALLIPIRGKLATDQPLNRDKSWHSSPQASLQLGNKRNYADLEKHSLQGPP